MSQNNSFSLAIVYKNLRWTVVIGAMLKTGFAKKVHIQGFVNKPTVRFS